jgi:rare lipoprotein A
MLKIQFLCLVFFISACSTNHKTARSNSHKTNAGRYAIAQDRAPDFESHIPNEIKPWTIAPEPHSKYGNHSPYVVFGKTYYLTNTNQDFEQTGTASWYGKKFHGHTTSNMEIFDMYKMTAAHRTLPLPSYVEVTNLENNKKVIVRVNDRGPFKSKRIIDLSWGAARALGYDKKGLANVHIKLIQAPGTKKTPEQNQLVEYKTTKVNNSIKYLQIGAYSEKNKAMEIAKKISKKVFLPVHVTNTVAANPLFRVRIGPLSENENIIDIIQKVHRQGFQNTKMVVE